MSGDRFAANASHELRTPLAISQAILDVAAQDPDRDVRGDLDRLRAVNARSIALTEASLLLSRAGDQPARTEPSDLSLLAEDAVETLVPFADERGVSIAVDTESAPVSGDPVSLTQMASNLVHNAIVHNTAEHGVIEVRTGTSDGHSTLIVENTGPVVSDAQAATLTEPFQRGGRPRPRRRACRSRTRSRDRHDDRGHPWRHTHAHAEARRGTARRRRPARGRLRPPPTAGSLQGHAPVATPRLGSDDHPDQLAG